MTQPAPTPAHRFHRQPPSSNGHDGGGPSARIGPHPGFISSSNQYTSETRIRRMFRHNGCDPAREDNYRLQGVQLIENVREHLKLPVRTFDTACTYFHKFRLNFRDAEYNFQDAALASLFVACKVEDTIKKSKDILAAAYAVKNPDKPAPADEKIFDQSGKIMIGLERLILETIGFDFRTRYPQKLLVKVVRSILGASGGGDNSSSSSSSKNDDENGDRRFYATAHDMCLDMYRTLVPVKRTTFAMVVAVVELTDRLLTGGARLARIRAFAAQHCRHRLGESAVVETMLDLLDLYVQHHRATKLGAGARRLDITRFIDIKIQLNNDLDRAFAPRFLYRCEKCQRQDSTASNSSSNNNNNTNDVDENTSVAPWPVGGGGGDSSVRRSARAQDGTMRFVFDPEAARIEQDTVRRFFRQDFEEYEVEIEEPVPSSSPPSPQSPPPPPEEPRAHRDGGGGHHHDGRGFGGGGHHHDGRGFGGGGGGHGGRGGGGRRLGGGGGRRRDRRGEQFGGHGSDRSYRGRGRRR